MTAFFYDKKMIVLRIIKKNEEGVVIHLDNGEVLFLSLEVLLKNNIRVKTEIDDEKYQLLITENRKYYLRKSALNFIGRRVHSRFELQQKLRKKGYEQELISEVLESLENAKILDDEVFADRFIEEYLNRKKWGKKKMEAALMQRGVNRNIISAKLNVYYTGDDELENAVILARKKYKILSNRTMEEAKLKQKLYAFLISRGFNFEIASGAIKVIFEDCTF